jgi:hypothetical protein
VTGEKEKKQPLLKEVIASEARQSSFDIPNSCKTGKRKGRAHGPAFCLSD